jgi:hypothetical protein
MQTVIDRASSLRAIYGALKSYADCPVSGLSVNAGERAVKMPTPSARQIPVRMFNRGQRRERDRHAQRKRRDLIFFLFFLFLFSL